MAAATLPFLQDMAVVLIIAGVATLLFHRLRQPVVLGYILAGVVVGPHTPPFGFVQDLHTIEVLAEMGVVFLLFGLGLEFNLRKLRRVGFTAAVAGVLQAVLMVWLGYVVGRAFGFGPVESVFLGAVISISSTVIIVKILEEYRQRDEPWAQIVLGILIVEDILAVVILTILSAGPEAGMFSLAGVGAVLLRLLVFVAAALVLGLVVVPRLVGWVAGLPVEEVLVVTVVGLAFGLAILGSVLGFSAALGAFIMGAIISESPAARKVERRILPLRDLFTAIFFVVIGMLVDPRAIAAHAWLILAVAAVVVVGKVVTASFGTFVTGHDVPTSLRVGFGLAQIGEFSFVIAAAALARGLTGAPLFEVAVSVAALTAFTTPVLIRAAPRAVTVFERIAPRPLLTFASLYGAWVARLRGMRAEDPRRRAAAAHAVRAAVYAAVTVAVVVAGGASVELLGRLLGPTVGPGPALLVAAWAVVGVAALPFGALTLASLHRFVALLAEAAVPDAARGSVAGANVRRVLARTFFLVGVVVLGVVLLGFASPFVPTLPILLVVGLVVAVSATLLYGSLRAFQRRVDDVLAEVLSDDAGDARRKVDLLALIQEKYPWDVETTEIRVPERAAAAHRAIRDLDLRARTGASVVGLQRGEARFLNPDPAMPLLPGDVVVVMGEHEQVEAAARLLGAERTEAEPSGGSAGSSEIGIRPGSALEGETLASARLRARTGATVVGIVRAGVRTMNPGPYERLAAGDVLLVVGTPEERARVRALAGDEGQGGRMGDEG